ncbi:MAG: FKBP-type peptidyl-prolyl cis-trans isomerase [Bdellovibrionaceae bacterium]|nr:FKBP-type peptidyl-prolyl cis-trans isomerase [Pseudobdellovibrionaceae bacterium]
MISKSKLLVGLTVTVAFGMVACEKKLDTDQKRASYAIGQQLGKNFKDNNVEFDADVLVMALKDVKENKTSKMTPDEMGKAMQKLQEMATQKQGQVAEDNKKKGEEFLEKNKSNPNVKTTESGLQYVVEKEGTGKSPAETDEVKVHYTGTLTDGTKFDSSVDRGQPAEFPVNGVIKGWTEALKLMKEGSKYKLTIPADLAYGPMGRPGIPPNSVLLFDVELLEVKAAQASAPAPKPSKKKTN